MSIGNYDVKTIGTNLNCLLKKYMHWKCLKIVILLGLSINFILIEGF